MSTSLRYRARATLQLTHANGHRTSACDREHGTWRYNDRKPPEGRADASGNVVSRLVLDVRVAALRLGGMDSEIASAELQRLLGVGKVALNDLADRLGRGTCAMGPKARINCMGPLGLPPGISLAAKNQRQRRRRSRTSLSRLPPSRRCGRIRCGFQEQGAHYPAPAHSFETKIHQAELREFLNCRQEPQRVTVFPWMTSPARENEND